MLQSVNKLGSSSRALLLTAGVVRTGKKGKSSLSEALDLWADTWLSPLTGSSRTTTCYSFCCMQNLQEPCLSTVTICSLQTSARYLQWWRLYSCWHAWLTSPEMIWETLWSQDSLNVYMQRRQIGAGTEQNLYVFGVWHDSNREIGEGAVAAPRQLSQGSGQAGHISIS